MYDDEFNGQGGRYLLDPTTGKRTRIDDEPAASAIDPATSAIDPVIAPVVRSKTKKSVDETTDPNPIIDGVSPCL